MMGKVANVLQCSTDPKGGYKFCTFLSLGDIPSFRGLCGIGKPAEAWSS